MLIITHNLHVVRHIAGRMAIMYLGRIVESGPTARLFAAPCHPYTAALLSASPRPDPDVKPQRLEISGEIPSLFRRPSGCEFHTRCPFVREKCRFEPPTLTVAGPGIFFTCHFPLTSPRAASGQGSSI
jgi:peptide/nickel transport system ATP-binding protein